MTFEIVKLFETAQTDGYNTKGDGVFFLDFDLAVESNKIKHSGYATGPLEHSAIKIQDTGDYFLLKSTKPVELVDEKKEREDVLVNIRGKLSDNELKLLGVSVASDE